MCIEPPRPRAAAVVAAEQLGHDRLGRRAARERVAVRAVGRDQVVRVAQRARRADDRRLLADGEVQEAADLRLRVHLARALLEAADEQHRREPLARDVGLGERAVGHRPHGTAAMIRRRGLGRMVRRCCATRRDRPGRPPRPGPCWRVRRAGTEWSPHVRGAWGLGGRRRGARRRARGGAAAGRRADPRGGDARRRRRRAWTWRVGPVEVGHEVRALRRRRLRGGHDAAGARARSSRCCAATYGPVVARLMRHLARVAARP